MIIFSNDYIEVSIDSDKVLLKTLKVGFPLKKFDEILSKHPRIKLTNFALLKSVLSKETQEPTLIGRWAPILEIDISKDKMKATLIVNDTKEAVRENIEQLQRQIYKLLIEKNIKYGILPIDLANANLEQEILVAKGTEPVKGEDAIVTYYELPERKPVIHDDGKANYFDMNFILEIEEGDWIGEKIPAKPGIPGKNIFGDVIPGPAGKDIPLIYDRNSAREVQEGGKIVLRATSKGALEKRQGQLSVSRHLPIDGDIGVETGNIEFDGSITVRGTVQSGFIVIATGDISIESPEGVTGAKLIKSTEGDVFIRGGIFGLGETIVEAGKNIYVKHVNEANLIAGNEIVIGSYALGSNLSAFKIKVDERKGKIIGGRAVAKDSIATALTGNRLERRTELIIENINKEEKQEILKEKAAKLKELNEDIHKYTAQINNLKLYENNVNNNQATVLQQAKQLLDNKKSEAKKVDLEIRQLMNELRTTHKEEILIRNLANPGTYIQIGKKSKLITRHTNGTFKLENGELNV